jgi:hypothetical protein
MKARLQELCADPRSFAAQPIASLLRKKFKIKLTANDVRAAVRDFAISAKCDIAAPFVTFDSASNDRLEALWTDPAGITGPAIKKILEDEFPGKIFSLSQIRDRASKMGLTRANENTWTAKTDAKALVNSHGSVYARALEHHGPEPDRVRLVPPGTFPANRFSMMRGAIR